MIVEAGRALDKQCIPKQQLIKSATRGENNVNFDVSPSILLCLSFNNDKLTNTTDKKNLKVKNMNNVNMIN